MTEIRLLPSVEVVAVSVFLHRRCDGRRRRRDGDDGDGRRVDGPRDDDR